MKTLTFLAGLLLAGGAHAAEINLANSPDPAGLAMTRDLNVCALPTWPGAALARGAEGKTTVAVQVDGDGRVTASRVDVSSGHEDLDQAALAGIAKCRFHALAAAAATPGAWRQTQFVWYLPAPPEKPTAELIAAVRAAADGGAAAAQMELGWWYQSGRLGSIDLALAEQWYRRAADSGDAAAQIRLADFYMKAEPWRPDEALDWLRRAAQAGSAEAQTRLAWIYDTGAGTARDDDEALYWITQAAASGKPEFQARLGKRLLQRADNDADRARGVEWLERAAAQDHALARLFLAGSYERGIGVQRDEPRAAALYRAALGQTDGRAEFELAGMVEEGRGVPADPAAAAQLFRQAMEASYPPAFARYARMLETGSGVARDESKAIDLYLQAADMGDCEAMRSLGRLYRQRDNATKQAYEWIGRAIFCSGRRGTNLSS
ncbi:TonB family protein [Pseudoduganella chitinolytica]|uniref:TonB family protein n=1 Tax=Pseudoduganella chitinolytica TaxID=34070 RepID=A0ABY8BDV6_9BURK|nr:TonB family protein [Pseudoduganella chitinolytica]WEF33881.1 TonB family protein [Pseudoduganella chitinolytica]